MPKQKTQLFEVRKDLHNLIDPEKAAFYPNFFKTGPGEYGAGDIFIGVTVPNIRKVARQYKHLPLTQITKLLKSKIHEERLLALIIMTEQFKIADKNMRLKIYTAYMTNKKYVNNWDLVDSSAHKIVGEFLLDKSRSILYILSQSKILWDRRIAIIATYQFIKNNQFKDTLKIAELLLKDDEDLMHKAVGWMLREVGKRDLQAQTKFLNTHYHKMPRTMLRYAIEKFPEKQRQKYLKGKI